MFCPFARCFTLLTPPRTSMLTSTRSSRCLPATSMSTTSGGTCGQSSARCGRRTARRTSPPTRSSTPMKPSLLTCESPNMQACLFWVAFGFQKVLSSLNSIKKNSYALLCLCLGCATSSMPIFQFLFSSRNIFQDVAHRDTLVKSFIDEVSFHIYMFSLCFFVILKVEKQVGCNRAVPHTQDVVVCSSYESAIDISSVGSVY